MSREIMQQALDALKYHTEHTYPFHQTNVAMEALRQALAQPEPICRDDGRCQYAIDHGAEGMGHCPVGKCCMPQNEQEPEPVAWLVSDAQGRYATIRDPAPYGEEVYEPLYAAPPKQWVGLTDEEIDSIFVDYGWCISTLYLRVVRSIEAKLKEKNT